MKNAQLVAKLTQNPVSAESLCRALGYSKEDCRWVVPQLNAARAEGKAVRETVTDGGHVHWRLP